MAKRRRVTRKNINNAQSDEIAGDALRVDPVHDPDYYMDNGDCIIRVENTLFKIHRFVLSRDSSAFADMFELPCRRRSGGVAEGLTDHKPIHLYGDSVQAFKALLGVLYALPEDFQRYTTLSTGNFECLLSIAEITNKYNFTSTELWATNSILKTVRKPENCLYTLEPDLVLRTLTMASLQSNTELRDAVISILVTRVLEGDVPPLPALTVANTHSLRTLQGAAYYAQLMKMHRSTVRRDDSFTPMTLVEDKSWSNAEHTRLLFGFWSLVHHSEDRRTHPIFCVPDDLQCARSCRIFWNRAWRLGWRKSAGSHKPADVLGKLKYVEEFLPDEEYDIPKMHKACRNAALEGLAGAIEEFQDNLLDHFTDFTSPLFLESVEEDGLDEESDVEDT